MKKLSLVLALMVSIGGFAQLKGLKEKVKTATTKPGLSNEEVIRGLKEALTVGTNSSSSIASQVDGYY